MSSAKTPKTSAMLRDEIDRGKAGDKVGFPDPAAAPLGTDAEAGGASPTEKEVGMAYDREIEGRPDSPEVASEPRPVSPDNRPRSTGGNWTIIAVVLALLLAGLVIYVTFV